MQFRYPVEQRYGRPRFSSLVEIPKENKTEPWFLPSKMSSGCMKSNCQ